MESDVVAMMRREREKKISVMFLVLLREEEKTKRL
jgi:hypothetical protein